MCPLLLCGYLWWRGDMSLENLGYLCAGLLVMVVFVATLGVHCGMTYSNSRTAISVSLGAVFFLFVGVVTCIVMMISFSGSFQTQLTPFLAFIMGGSIGLYVALGFRNPSSAIFWASLLLPVATFFAIVSFVLRDRELTVCLVVALTYGFTTAAMLVPAISEFDIAMGRTKTGERNDGGGLDRTAAQNAGDHDTSPKRKREGTLSPLACDFGLELARVRSGPATSVSRPWTAAQTSRLYPSPLTIASISSKVMKRRRCWSLYPSIAKANSRASGDNSSWLLVNCRRSTPGFG